MEGRSLIAVTHLAEARRQNTGNGILGYFTKEEKAARLPFLYLRQDITKTALPGSLYREKSAFNL